MAKTHQEHDKQAERRVKIVSEMEQLGAKFRKDDAAAAARIEKLEAPVIAAIRERQELAAEHRRAVHALGRERELCEARLSDWTHPDIEAVSKQCDELEEMCYRGAPQLSEDGEDLPITRIRRVRAQLEILKLEPSSALPDRLAELKKELPDRGEAANWSYARHEKSRLRKTLGAVLGGRRNRAAVAAQ